MMLSMPHLSSKDMSLLEFISNELGNPKENFLLHKLPSDI